MRMLPTFLSACIYLALAGCGTMQKDATTNSLAPDVFGELKENGITFALPSDWKKYKKDYIKQAGKSTFVCENFQSPYPSAKSSRTYLGACVPIDKGIVLNVKTFVEAARADVAYDSNVTNIKHNDVEEYLFTDNLGREWKGYRYVSEVRGINSISGGPFIEDVVNVVVPISGNQIIWLIYFVPIHFDTGWTEPYSYSLSAFDYVIK